MQFYVAKKQRNKQQKAPASRFTLQINCNGFAGLPVKQSTCQLDEMVRAQMHIGSTVHC